MHRLALFVALAACSSPGAEPPPDVTMLAPRALGLNDVSMLLPLPADPAAPTLLALAGAGGVPLVANGPIAGLDFRGDIGPKDGPPFQADQLQVVAVRFELCDRRPAGPCAPGADGLLRLVLQPVIATATGTSTLDIAVHAFYPIPAHDLPGVVGELRLLAAVQDVPVSAPLAVSTGSPSYLTYLRSLVLRYARWDRLARLTTIGQRAGSVAFNWVFRGIELDATGTLAAMTIPAVGAASQSIAVQGGDTVYVGEPLVDAPAGFGLAINGQAFDAAPAADQAASLAALAAINNPASHDTGDLQCTTCHVATYLTMRRASFAGVDPAAIPGSYTSTFDTTVDSLANTEPRLIRAFGWVDAHPIISIRVANESARVAAEMESRFPPPAR
ncbi:MAG TPA: hypothetical protein VGC42_13780 [Kofleriaceae bacterium]